MDLISAAASLLPVPGEWVLQGGAVGLLGLVVLLILAGRLVPRRTYQDMERDRDQWRDVALKAMGHTDQLLPAARITTQVTQALSDATATEQALSGQAGPGGAA